MAQEALGVTHDDATQAADPVYAPSVHELTSTASLVVYPHRYSCLVNNLVYVAGVWNNFRTARLVSSVFLLKSD